jgi:iron complex transport system substrate-binding protein
VRALPACTSSNIDSNASSAEIDREVKSLLQQTLSLYNVNLPLLRELRPDLIITQAQCDVCAVSYREVDAALGDWEGHRPQIMALAPKGIGDVIESVTYVASRIGAHAASNAWDRTNRERISALKALTKSKARPNVVCIEWLDPLMAAGNWVPSLVELGGGTNLIGKPGEHSPWMTWEQLAAADPDVIVVTACGFNLERTRREYAPFSQRAEWQSLRAVRESRVYLADGNQFFNRPGPRIIESAEIIAEILHPDACSFGHKNHHWQPA